MQLQLPGKGTTERLAWVGLLIVLLTGCTSTRPGAPLKRTGDEIIAAGQLFHTGTRVVTWMDPSGYDAYRCERRFAPVGIVTARVHPRSP